MADQTVPVPDDFPPLPGLEPLPLPEYPQPPAHDSPADLEAYKNHPDDSLVHLGDGRVNHGPGSRAERDADQHAPKYRTKDQKDRDKNHPQRYREETLDERKRAEDARSEKQMEKAFQRAQNKEVTVDDATEAEDNATRRNTNRARHNATQAAGASRQKSRRADNMLQKNANVRTIPAEPPIPDEPPRDAPVRPSQRPTRQPEPRADADADKIEIKEEDFYMPPLHPASQSPVLQVQLSRVTPFFLGSLMNFLKMMMKKLLDLEVVQHGRRDHMDAHVQIFVRLYHMMAPFQYTNHRFEHAYAPHEEAHRWRTYDPKLINRHDKRPASERLREKPMAREFNFFQSNDNYTVPIPYTEMVSNPDQIPHDIADADASTLLANEVLRSTGVIRVFVENAIEFLKADHDYFTMDADVVAALIVSYENIRQFLGTLKTAVRTVQAVMTATRRSPAPNNTPDFHTRQDKLLQRSTLQWFFAEVGFFTPLNNSQRTHRSIARVPAPNDKLHINLLHICNSIASNQLAFYANQSLMQQNRMEREPRMYYCTQMYAIYWTRKVKLFELDRATHARRDYQPADMLEQENLYIQNFKEYMHKYNSPRAPKTDPCFKLVKAQYDHDKAKFDNQYQKQHPVEYVRYLSHIQNDFLQGYLNRILESEAKFDTFRIAVERYEALRQTEESTDDVPEAGAAEAATVAPLGRRAKARQTRNADTDRHPRGSATRQEQATPLQKKLERYKTTHERILALMDNSAYPEFESKRVEYREKLNNLVRESLQFESMLLELKHSAKDHENALIGLEDWLDLLDEFERWTRLQKSDNPKLQDIVEEVENEVQVWNEVAQETPLNKPVRLLFETMRNETVALPKVTITLGQLKALRRTTWGIIVQKDEQVKQEEYNKEERVAQDKATANAQTILRDQLQQQEEINANELANATEQYRASVTLHQKNFKEYCNIKDDDNVKNFMDLRRYLCCIVRNTRAMFIHNEVEEKANQLEFEYIVLHSMQEKYGATTYILDGKGQALLAEEIALANKTTLFNAADTFTVATDNKVPIFDADMNTYRAKWNVFLQDDTNNFDSPYILAPNIPKSGGMHFVLNLVRSVAEEHQVILAGLKSDAEVDGVEQGSHEVSEAATVAAGSN